MQSTPIPMMPRQVSLGIPGSSSGINFPVNYLQKAGVYVQRIITTTGNNNAPPLAGQCSLAHHYTHICTPEAYNRLSTELPYVIL